VTMTILLSLIIAITSLVGVAIGWRGGVGGLAAAVGVVLETIGATVLFFAANLAVGATLVLAGRWYSYFYTTLYEVTDITLLVVSVIQALLVTIWRRGG
jgi:hypothetical protein